MSGPDQEGDPPIRSGKGPNGRMLKT